MISKEMLMAGIITAQLFTFTPAAEMDKYDEIQKAFNPPVQEQIAEPENQITGVNKEDMAQAGYDYFEQKEQFKETLEQSKLPHDVYSAEPPSTEREAAMYEFKANDMEQRLESINNLVGEEVREQAFERFEQQYGVSPDDAPAKISEYREQAAQIRDGLNPTEPEYTVKHEKEPIQSYDRYH